MDGASDGETGIGVAGTKLPAFGIAGAPGSRAPAPDAPLAGSTPLAPRCFASIRRSRSVTSLLPEGGALTTLGRRLCSLAARRSFCSSGNCS